MKNIVDQITKTYKNGVKSHKIWLLQKLIKHKDLEKYIIY